MLPISARRSSSGKAAAIQRGGVRRRPSSGSWTSRASRTASSRRDTGLSAGYLNHLVHGNRPVPSNDVVKTLADALEVEPEHFREFRLRMITERLEAMPELDRPALSSQLAEPPSP